MKYEISAHSVTRYCERVKPALDHRQGAQELRALVDLAGEPSPDPPEWLIGFQPDSSGFLELSDGIVAGIQGRVVATVLVRSGSTSVYRQRRNESKAKRRKTRRTQKRLDNFNGSSREPRQRWG